jgi:threonyl-tRNA synthetase
VAEGFAGYAREVEGAFREAGLRVKVDDRDSKLGAKVALAETAKVNYIAVVGAREREGRTVNLRAHGGRNLGSVPLAEAVERLARESRERLLGSVFDPGREG